MSFLLVDSIFFVIHCVIESIHNSKKKKKKTQFRNLDNLLLSNHCILVTTVISSTHLPPSLSNYTQNKSFCVHTLASNYTRTPYTCKSFHFPTSPPTY